MGRRESQSKAFLSFNFFMRTSIPIILIIVTNIFGYFYLPPSYERVKAVSAEIKAVDDALQKTREIGSVAEGLRNKIESISPSDLDKLDAVLPGRVDEIRFLNMLNSLALRRGIILEGLTVKKNENIPANVSARTTQQNSLSASFSLFVPYRAFKIFLADLEQSLVVMDVSSFTLSVPADGGGGKAADSYTYKVDLLTYWKE